MTKYDKVIEKVLNDEKDKHKNTNNRSTFNYEKEEIFGEIEISDNWEIQVTRTSWNNRKSKYEIRKWKKDGTPGKGITCTEEQFLKLIELLKNIKL